jgi:hypothetical protein
MTRQRVLYVLIGVMVLAALIGAWSFRRPFVDAARADLEGRGLYWFDLLGTRIPCHGLFDVGVSLVFKKNPDDEVINGRLCRALDRSSPWNFYPDPVRVRSGAAGK